MSDNPPQAPYQPQPQGYAPSQQQQTVININQPQSQNTIQGQPQNIRDWSTGMCGCFEDCSGCKIYFTLVFT